MPQLELEKLTQAKKLFKKGKIKEALQLLDDLQKEENLSSQDQLSSYLLKGSLLISTGQYNEALTLAEFTYQESKKLKRSLQLIDALILKARVLSLLGRLDNAFDIILEADSLIKALTNESPLEITEREAWVAFIKGAIFGAKGDKDSELEALKQSLALREELDDKQGIFTSLTLIAKNFWASKGDLDQALKYTKCCQAIAEQINNEQIVAYNLVNLGIIYNLKGELNLSQKYYEQSLALFKKVNNKPFIATCLTNLGDIYQQKRDLDRALDYQKQSLTIYEELENKIYLSSVLESLVAVLLDKRDYEQAQLYLDNLKKINEEEENKEINLRYQFSRALFLKSSPRLRDRGRAEEILKQITEQDIIYIETTSNALTNLCDLLLFELQMTNDIEILNEINHTISRLLDITEKNNSYSLLAETYLLQARLALLTLELKKARRLLTHAQSIAEEHGLKLLAMKISNEHDELLKQQKIWENLKEKNAPLNDRMKYAHLDDQIERMVQRRAIENPDLSAENPVILLIISEGGEPIFSQSFMKEWTFEDYLFGGFLTAVNSFSGEIFSEGLDRASFGQYTLLMKSISPFSVCYLFKGQTYLAQKRLQIFIESIQNNKEIWQTFQKFHQENQIIQIKDIPGLEPLITDTFITRNISLND